MAATGGRPPSALGEILSAYSSAQLTNDAFSRPSLGKIAFSSLAPGAEAIFQLRSLWGMPIGACRSSFRVTLHANKGRRGIF